MRLISKSLRRLGLTAAVLATLAACGPREVIDRPNLLVVLVDTLRGDHLSVAGYPLETSPQLERLAERGTYFDRFYAHSAVTRPSVATLLTSRYVSGHRIVSQARAGLSADLPYLPQILRRAGYRTAAFVTNPQVHPLLGFGRGFDRFEELYSGDVDPVQVRPQQLIKLPAGEVFSALRDHLEALDAGVPFFAYVHLLDPHGPYQPPAEDLARFADPDYDGDFIGSIRDFTRLERLREHPADLAHFTALYDAEVRSTDRALGELVGWLDATGRLADTHLLITADHGEELMEHGSTGHAFQLYEETVRIPLLWIGPGVPAGHRVGQLAGLVDVMPTLLDVLRLPAGGLELQGHSFKTLLRGGQPAEWRQALFLEGLARRRDNPGDGPAVARGLVTDTRKVLARGCVVGRVGCRSFEILDLAADPGEQAGRTVSPGDPDLSDDERRLLRLYQREEAAALSADPDAGFRGELPPEALERLESLGYVDP